MVALMCASGGRGCRNRVQGRRSCAAGGLPVWRSGLFGIVAGGRRGRLCGRGIGNPARVSSQGCMQFPSHIPGSRPSLWRVQ
eukprot:scaffold248417_cov67-Attheya_sp.AAC.6